MERNEIFEEIDASEEREFIKGDKTEVSANFVCILEEKEYSDGEKIYSTTVCGRSLAEWVGKACPKKPMFLSLSENENFLDLIRPYTNQNEYTVVLFASTPLLTRETILDMLGFASRKRLNVCRLKVGYILKNDYISGIDEIYSKLVYTLDTNDFFEVKSREDLDFVKKIIGKRVFSFHKQNGVTFEQEKLTNLDADVHIGQGSQISGMVSLLSGSFIGNGVTIQEGSIISNSKIGDGVIIETGSIIKNSIIKAGSVIETACVINHSVIGENCRVSIGCILDDTATKTNVSIGENSNLCGVNVLNNAKVGKNCVIIGSSGENKNGAFVISENAELEACTKIINKA